MRSPVRRVVAVGVSAAAALSFAFAPTPAAAFSTANGVRLNAVEARLVALINQARTSRGIRALVVTPGTTDLARVWSMSQATRNTLQHNPNLVSGIEHHGSAYWHVAAENVGRGWGADSLFNAYMNSPHHRENILDPAQRYLGMGWVERPDGSGYNTQVFVDQYSVSYGHNRVPAVGGLADTRTPSSLLSVASFESGWDSRVLLARSGSGLATSGPSFESPTTTDQSVRFAVRETAVASGGGVDLRVRDALDFRNASGLRLKLGATTASGRPITVQVGLRRELGTNAVLGQVVVPSGGWVTVTLPIPSSARNFRNVVGIAVSRAALQSLSSSLAGRSVTVRVADIAVVA